MWRLSAQSGVGTWYMICICQRPQSKRNFIHTHRLSMHGSAGGNQPRPPRRMAWIFQSPSWESAGTCM
jgi:hypothetical protein